MYDLTLLHTAPPCAVELMKNPFIVLIVLIDRFILFLGGCFISCFLNCEREGRREKERKGWGERENVNTTQFYVHVLTEVRGHARHLAHLSSTLVF